MTKKQRLRDKADKLWKLACFEKYGRVCEICGGNYKPTAHHYYYRSSCSHLRFDLDNGVILDAKCHFLLHFRDPKPVEEQIIKIRGKKWLNRLKKKANNPPKYFNFNEQFIEKAIKNLNEPHLSRKIN